MLAVLASDVPRWRAVIRELLRDALQRAMKERDAAAAGYERAGQEERAARLRAGAAVLDTLVRT